MKNDKDAVLITGGFCRAEGVQKKEKEEKEMRPKDLLQKETEEKPLGMLYFWYMYKIRCPLMAVRGVLIALSFFLIFVYDPVFIGSIVIAIFNGIEAVAAIIMMKQYRRYKREGTCSESLYVATQRLIWIGGVAWVATMGVYVVKILMSEVNEGTFEISSLVGGVLGIVLSLLPAYWRFKYFRNRKSVYEQAISKTIVEEVNMESLALETELSQGEHHMDELLPNTKTNAERLPKTNKLIAIMLGVIIIILISIVIFLLIDRKSEDTVSSSKTPHSSNEEILSKPQNNYKPSSEEENSSDSAMEKEIKEAESKSAYNKSQYEKKYQYYMGLERYTGSQASYNTKISSLDKETLQAYVDCQNKINKLYSSNMSSGYIESYKRQYENERDQKMSEIAAEKADLEAAWQNQQNYLKYYNLYLDEDEKLANEIKLIKDKYK